MASLAFYVAYFGMLGVVKVSQVRQVVNPYPLDRFLVVESLYNLSNLAFTGVGARLDLIVAVHTNIDRRDGSALAFHYAYVTIFTVDLVLTGVNFMRECDRLFRSITDVNQQGNKYYDKLVELHNAKGKKGAMKVEDIGGLECSKCHY